MTKEQWGQLKQELLGTVGKHNFANWIEPLELSDVSDGVATFNVPTTFTGNYVSRNFGDLILFQVNTVSPDIRRVHFRVPANATARPEPAAPRPCLLYTSPSPRDRQKSRMPSSA